MSEQMNDDYDTDEMVEDERQQSPRELRRAANKGKALERENSELKRKLAFVEAGISTTDPKMSYFVKGYEGELTAESIRQAALEAGFIAAQQEQPAPEVQQAANAHQRLMQASAGATALDSSEQAALARLEQAMQEGGVEAMLDVARQYGIPTAYDT